MVYDYAALVSKLVASNHEYGNVMEWTHYVTPKAGNLVEKTIDAPAFLTEHHVPRGKIMRETPEFAFQRRTAFRKDPVTIRGEKHYLELKGYGAEGREIFFNEHCSGDVMFGMYLELALREHRRACQALQLGLPVTLPLAVYEIPREEYIRVGVKGFRELVGCVGFLEHTLREKVRGIVGQYEGLSRQTIGRRLLRHAQKNVGGSIEEQVAFLCAEFHSDSMDILGFNDKGKALLCGKPVGYLWRATRCPIRLGDPTDESMDVPENHIVAKRMGETFKTLLENGILHHCPGTGNWTLACELTDFADTFDLRTDVDELHRHLDYLVNEKRIFKPTMDEFMRYLIGPVHNGVLNKSFLAGLGETDLTRATRMMVERVPSQLR